MARERVVVVGAGGISNAWFPPIKLEELQVVAVVDLRIEAAEAQIEKFKLPRATASNDLDKILREVQADFLVDLTVPQSHCDVTCRALEAGLHVIGEKPMATSMDEARRMIAASERSGKMYMISQSRRWDGRHATIAATLAGGVAGKLTTLNCDFFLGAHFGGFRDEMPSPLILDMAIHHFDLARMFCQSHATSVYAEEFSPAGSWYKGGAAANCLFEMASGVHFAYRGSWCAEGCDTSWNGDWRIIGDNGTLLYASDKEPSGEVVAGAEGFQRARSAMPISSVPMLKTGMHGGLHEMLCFLRSGRVPQTECHDNIQSLAMVLGAVESSKVGRRVQIGDL